MRRLGQGRQQVVFGGGLGIADIFRRVGTRSAQDRTSSEALASLRALSSEQFEARLRNVLGDAGYAVDFYGGEGSSEADLVLRRRGERTLLQYRYWNLPTVAYRHVRDLYELMQQEGAAACTLVTCGVFQQRAIEFAQMKPIELVNGAALLKRMPNIICEPLGMDLASDIKTSFQPESILGPNSAMPSVDKAHEGDHVPQVLGEPMSDDAWIDDEEGPRCPRCQGPMAMHTAGIGGAAGHQFWACLRFPGCKGTRPV